VGSTFPSVGLTKIDKIYHMGYLVCATFDEEEASTQGEQRRTYAPVLLYTDRVRQVVGLGGQGAERSRSAVATTSSETWAGFAICRSRTE
jgi:hypothetical protein